MDDYVRKLSPSNIALIKIDVDGHEPEVIAGSWMTNEKFRPDILLEWCPHLFKNQPGVMENIIELFINLQYYIFHADSLRQITLEKLIAITPKLGSINILLSTKFIYK